MPKFKVTGEITADAPPVLPAGLTVEAVSALPLSFNTRYSGRVVEVRKADDGPQHKGAYVSFYNQPNSFLDQEECQLLGEALLEAAGRPVGQLVKPVYYRGDAEPPESVKKVRDKDGDLWTRRTDGSWSGSSWESITRYAPLTVVDD